jgi:hypothetical protein
MKVSPCLYIYEIPSSRQLNLSIGQQVRCGPCLRTTSWLSRIVSQSAAQCWGPETGRCGL